MVSVLNEFGKNYGKSDFENALSEGSRWASVACTSKGGAGKCPKKELADFIDKVPSYQKNNVETRSQAVELMTFIDLAY